MLASRLPIPNSPDFARLAQLLLKSKNGSKNFYELLRPISTQSHTERPRPPVNSGVLKMENFLQQMYFNTFVAENT